MTQSVQEAHTLIHTFAQSRLPTRDGSRDMPLSMLHLTCSMPAAHEPQAWGGVRHVRHYGASERHTATMPAPVHTVGKSCLIRQLIIFELTPRNPQSMLAFAHTARAPARASRAQISPPISQGVQRYGSFPRRGGEARVPSPADSLSDPPFLHPSAECLPPRNMDSGSGLVRYFLDKDSCLIWKFGT